MPDRELQDGGGIGRLTEDLVDHESHFRETPGLSRDRGGAFAAIGEGPLLDVMAPLAEPLRDARGGLDGAQGALERGAGDEDAGHDGHFPPMVG